MAGNITVAWRIPPDLARRFRERAKKLGYGTRGHVAVEAALLMYLSAEDDVQKSWIQKAASESARLAMEKQSEVAVEMLAEAGRAQAAKRDDGKTRRRKRS